MNVEYIQAKSLVRRSGPSIFSWAEIYLNPYQGCYHNCVYCDGKSEQYRMHEDFGERIIVKGNAPALLKKFLKTKGFQPIHMKEHSTIDDFFPSLTTIHDTKKPPKLIINIGGGVCDVYQQAEKEVKMTRKLLEIVYDYQMPLWVLTKSDLVLRDLDLLKKINEEAYACVNFTITLADERAQKIFEPRASLTSERFEAIRLLRKEGIHSGIYLYPALPFIGDTDENINKIYQKAAEIGAEFIYCFGLTLKPGRNKDEFMQTIKEYYPEEYPKYRSLYTNNNKYGNLDYEQFREMKLMWPEIKGFKYGHEYKLDYAAKRYVPEGRIFCNLKLAEIARRIVFIKSMILHDSKYEINAFSQAAHLIENSTKDFTKLKRDNFTTIPTASCVRAVIREFVEMGYSKYLKELELRAYEQITKSKLNQNPS